jgi:hypothetical protein
MLDDAVIIAQSWHRPEQFAGPFDRHAPYIHRYIFIATGPP